MASLTPTSPSFSDGTQTPLHHAPTGSDGDELAVCARGLSVVGSEGPVYGPLDVSIPKAGLTVLCGRGGSGRTALALTLAGRMKPSSGTLTVMDTTAMSLIRRRVAIAGVDDIDMIDRDVRLKTTIAEHKAWHCPWIKWVSAPTTSYYESVCGLVFGDRPLPELSSYVSQISSLDRLLIRIALALDPAGTHKIRMLVMDDLEQVRELEDRILLLHVLARLAEKLPVVVTAVNPIDTYTSIPHTFFEVSRSSAKPAQLRLHRRRTKPSTPENSPEGNDRSRDSAPVTTTTTTTSDSPTESVPTSKKKGQ